MNFFNTRWLTVAGFILAGAGTILQAIAQQQDTEEMINKKVEEEIDRRLNDEDEEEQSKDYPLYFLQNYEQENDMKMSKLMKSATRYTSEHLPQILLGIGIGGMVGAVATAIKSTPKAMTKIEDKKEELEKDKLNVKETVQTTWKCYAPTVILMILSTACVVSANNIT